MFIRRNFSGSHGLVKPCEVFNVHWLGSAKEEEHCNESVLTRNNKQGRSLAQSEVSRGMHIQLSKLIVTKLAKMSCEAGITRIPYDRDCLTVLQFCRAFNLVQSGQNDLTAKKLW